MKTPERRKSDRERGQLHVRYDEPVPYRWPRGAVEGSRVGLRIAQAIAVVLLWVLVALVVYMAKLRWG